jgi:hypothetical protein
MRTVSKKNSAKMKTCPSDKNDQKIDLKAHSATKIKEN